MKINLVLLSILVVVLNFPINALGAYPERSVSLGTQFVSPDGRYSVELVEIDRESYYAIKDMATGRVDNSIVMPTLLLYLHWAANSRSIVTVEHIAHGSSGRVIYLKDARWKDVEIKPPDEKLMHYTVVNLTIKADRVHYRFALRHIKGNGMPLDYKFCDLDVDLQSGQISNVKWTPTSQREEAAALARKPVYVPPMQPQK
jgi:hypothetical protein